MNDWKTELQQLAGELQLPPEPIGKGGRRILHLKAKAPKPKVPETPEERERREKRIKRKAAKKKRLEAEKQQRREEKAFKKSLEMAVAQDKRKLSRVDKALMRSQNPEPRPCLREPEEPTGSIHAMGQIWNRFDLYKE